MAKKSEPQKAEQLHAGKTTEDMISKELEELSAVIAGNKALGIEGITKLSKLIESESLTDLRELILVNRGIDTKGAEMLFGDLTGKSLPNLTLLNIEGNRIKAEGANHIFTKVAEGMLPSLSSINLKRCYIDTTKSAFALPSILQAPSLSPPSSASSPTDPLQLQAKTAVSNITALDLGYNNLSLAGISMLFAVMSHGGSGGGMITNLKELGLEQTGISEGDLVKTLSSAKATFSLTSLNLANNRLSSGDIKAVALCLPELTKFNITSCLSNRSVTKETLRSLIETINSGNLPNLTELYLGYNNIDDQDIETILSKTNEKMLSQLTLLNLKGNYITTKGAGSILSLLRSKTLAGLIAIDLTDNNKIEPQSIAEIDSFIKQQSAQITASAKLILTQAPEEQDQHQEQHQEQEQGQNSPLPPLSPKQPPVPQNAPPSPQQFSHQQSSAPQHQLPSSLEQPQPQPLSQSHHFSSTPANVLQGVGSIEDMTKEHARISDKARTLQDRINAAQPIEALKLLLPLANDPHYKMRDVFVSSLPKIITLYSPEEFIALSRPFFSDSVSCVSNWAGVVFQEIIKHEHMKDARVQILTFLQELATTNTGDYVRYKATDNLAVLLKLEPSLKEQITKIATLLLQDKSEFVRESAGRILNHKESHVLQDLQELQEPHEQEQDVPPMGQCHFGHSEQHDAFDSSPGSDL